jgi:choline dehydrogenase-like flavoprotein
MSARLITNPAASWLYFSQPEVNTNGHRIPVPCGKLPGGSSAINGMAFVRGQAQDFDTWAQMEKRGLELPRRPGRRLPLRQWPGDYAGIDLQRRPRRWRKPDSNPRSLLADEATSCGGNPATVRRVRLLGTACGCDKDWPKTTSIPPLAGLRRRRFGDQ